MPATRHIICSAAELPPGTRRIVEIEARSIGIFNLNGQLYALKNVCPHRYAPLCEGPLTGLVTGDQPGTLVLERPGEIVRCPWHGWEFDIRTGRSVFNPNQFRTKTYAACFQNIRSSQIQGCMGTKSSESVETYPVGVEEQHVVVYL